MRAVIDGLDSVRLRIALLVRHERATVSSHPDFSPDFAILRSEGGNGTAPHRIAPRPAGQAAAARQCLTKVIHEVLPNQSTRIGCLTPHLPDARCRLVDRRRPVEWGAGAGEFYGSRGFS